MALFQTSEINLDFNKTHKLIYGYPGTGKTTLASFMVDGNGRRPTFAATEDRHQSLQVARARIRTWEGFTKYVDFLEANKEQLLNEHSCVVLDVVSDLDQWCGHAVAKSKNVEYVGDLDMGKGWSLQRQLFQKQIDRVMALIPVVFIAHVQEKKITWNGEQISTQAPNLSKGAMEYINGKVDTIMFIRPMTSKKLHPEISMRPSLDSVAKASQQALCRDFTFDLADIGKTYREICQVYTEGQRAELAKNNPVLAAQATVTQQAQAAAH